MRCSSNGDETPHILREFKLAKRKTPNEKQRGLSTTVYFQGMEAVISLLIRNISAQALGKGM